MAISILAGPKFIDFLRRKEFGQHIREEGPAGHHVKQGTPTMGGLLIVVSMIIPFLALSHYTQAGAHRLLRHARLRRDRVHRRLVQGPPPPLARPQRPLEAPAARGDHRRCRLVGARHRALDGRLRAGARLADRLSLRLLRPPVPDHRGRGERREPDRRHRRARGRGRDDRADHVHGDERRHVDPLGDLRPTFATPPRSTWRSSARRSRAARSASSGTTPSPPR